VTVGSEANGAPANSSGSAKFTVVVSPPNSDVNINVNITDIRCGSLSSPCGNPNTLAGPDYTGELELLLPLRITDRFSGAGGGVAATVQDTFFPVPVACSQTGNTSRGSNCTVVTTANAVLPGAVQTGRRTIWELERVQLRDGGSDGAAATAGNGLFATQGVFVP
jgi:hypothetical protein